MAFTVADYIVRRLPSSSGPTLIAAQVDAHGLPAKLTGAALAGGGPLR